jgi:hypothetical protein
VHGTASQQSLACVHCWPYCAQLVAPGAGGVPPLEPPSLPLVTPLAPQVPLEAPAGISQGDPAQQSAVVVHAPPAVMQALPEQTKGGVPDGFGTQGRLQQSALDAQAVPAAGGPLLVQS